MNFDGHKKANSKLSSAGPLQSQSGRWLHRVIMLGLVVAMVTVVLFAVSAVIELTLTHFYMQDVDAIMARQGTEPLSGAEVAAIAAKPAVELYSFLAMAFGVVFLCQLYLLWLFRGLRKAVRNG